MRNELLGAGKYKITFMARALLFPSGGKIVAGAEGCVGAQGITHRAEREIPW